MRHFAANANGRDQCPSASSEPVDVAAAAVFPWRAVYYPVRDVLGRYADATGGLFEWLFETPGLTGALIIRLVVPGWAQMYQGRRQAAMLFFSNWIGFLLSGLVCYGSTFGAVMLGLTFATHVGWCLTSCGRGWTWCEYKPWSADVWRRRCYWCFIFRRPA